MKCRTHSRPLQDNPVSLFTREWIEIIALTFSTQYSNVSLFTREWIEILPLYEQRPSGAVSLFTREWIEIKIIAPEVNQSMGLPLYEGVD